LEVVQGPEIYRQPRHGGLRNATIGAISGTNLSTCHNLLFGGSTRDRDLESPTDRPLRTLSD
jgi:hypothetical protein